ncbi:MAG: hypothetical protein LBG64_01285 [Pseudomonadales bacterium]|jgi:hypothetical protein|nr:hypothetical protein [Pseudomonadales bacterium]
MSQQKRWEELQEKHPSFTFSKFATEQINQDLQVSYYYSLANNPEFIHQVTFKNFSFERWQDQSEQLRQQLLFNLGLVEMFSYWKTTASAKIIIEAGELNNEQLKFWQELLQGGMGEFLYVNQLDPRVLQPNWQIQNESTSQANSATAQLEPSSSLVGIGGGKDSLVTTYLLNKANQSFDSLIIEPASPATNSIAELFSNHNVIKIERRFDPQMLKLNHNGYLNGHVPFSASAAFLGLISAVANGHQNFIVGNENSASEATATYETLTINHQYSKSFAFEKNFDQYCKQFIVNNVNYFSFIRPFYELKIAQIFCSLPEEFLTSFRSCNRGQKQGCWCGSCPKCLFVFLILAPFCDFDFLTNEIFHTNLFANEKLIEDAKKLTGIISVKPLECIGTIEESKVAFYLTLQKFINENRALTPMLELAKTEIIDRETDWEERVQKILTHYETDNLLPTWAQEITKSLI